MKAVAKYPGSKWSIADWIIQFFPEHHSYVEPFSDSGIDGKRNPSGTYGCACGLDIDKNGRSTKVIRAGFGENIPKPEWCGLQEVLDIQSI